MIKERFVPFSRRIKCSVRQL